MSSSAPVMPREEFDRIARLVLSTGQGEHTFLSLNDEAGGTTRFANNQIIQNINVRRQSLSVSAAFGKRHGRASTTSLSDESIRETVRRAEEIARASPEDPEYMPPLAQQQYQILATYRTETAAAGPSRRLEEAQTAIRACRREGLAAAGIVSAYTNAVGLAANTGLKAFEQRTSAQFSLTATSADSTGWVNTASRSVDDLKVMQQTSVAISKAQSSTQPREMPAGRYTVVLEPAAVAGLVGPVFGPLDARSYHKQTSALSGRLGQRIIDERLTLQNRPDHPSLLGAGFDGQGLAGDYQTWIDAGVLRRLAYDRFTAAEHNTQPTYRLDAPHLSGASPAGETVEDLVKTTDRGILVTNFWYIRSVNPTDLTLTGMTRDGTFLIEDGRVVCGLINFRFHDSPLRALNNVDAFTVPLDAITMEREKMMLPAVRVRDFNFSSVTRF